jgi:tRNA (guanine37-N1)-methyltransferase
MLIQVLTLFPEMFYNVFQSSILGKAHAKGIVDLHTVNFRDFAMNKHATVDDTPYGGGGGMVLKPEPIFAAVEHLLAERANNVEPLQPARIILMCPQGERFTQRKAEQWAREQHLIFICGHYEGYDERIREHLVTDECSIGDYVLTGGEIPAMTVIDSVVRLLPGALGNEHSAAQDSYSTGLLEYPHYTRPAQFRDWPVPDILLSGHHEQIEEWRMKQALQRTAARRPDLLDNIHLTDKQRKWLAQMTAQQNQ